MTAILFFIVSFIPTDQDQSWTIDDLGIFYRVSQRVVAIKPDGGLIVLDYPETNLRHYDKYGKFTGTIGREGQGPGEFERPSTVYIMNSLIYVESSNKCQVFDLNGKFIRGASVPNGNGSVHCVSDGWIILRNKGAGNNQLTWVNNEMGDERILTKFNIPLEFTSENGKVILHYNPNSEKFLMAFSLDRTRVFFRNPSKRTIEIFDAPSQKMLKPIITHFKAIPFDEEYGDRRFAQVRKSFVTKRNIKPVKNYPNYFPIISHLQWTAEGYLGAYQETERYAGWKQKTFYDNKGKPAETKFTKRMNRCVLGVYKQWAYVALFNKQDESAGVAKIPLSKLKEFTEEMYREGRL